MSDFNTITGVLLWRGVPVSGIAIYLHRVIKPGTLEQVRRKEKVAVSGDNGIIYRWDGSAIGAAGFELPKASDVWLSAAAEGLSADPINGTRFSIPDADGTTLDSLVSLSTAPTTGITVVGLAHKISTLIIGDGLLVEETSTGVATITVDVDALGLRPGDPGPLMLLGYL